jgi:hypothetical protein
MEKILFYGNSLTDFLEYNKYREALEKEGFELAFTTHNMEIIPDLAVAKMLTMKFGAYTPDLVVVNHEEHKKLFKWEVMLLKDFSEVFE